MQIHPVPGLVIGFGDPFLNDPIPGKGIFGIEKRTNEIAAIESSWIVMSL
jgi:hypothetical protein